MVQVKIVTIKESVEPVLILDTDQSSTGQVIEVDGEFLKEYHRVMTGFSRLQKKLQKIYDES